MKRARVTPGNKEENTLNNAGKAEEDQGKLLLNAGGSGGHEGDRRASHEKTITINKFAHCRMPDRNTWKLNRGLLSEVKVFSPSVNLTGLSS